MPHVISEEQRNRYEREGCLFPVPVLSCQEVAVFRSAFEELEVRLGGKPKTVELSQPHLHFRWAYDLVTHPAVLDVIEDVLGPDILVHSVSIFCKHPHDPAYVSWHQDGHYWGLDSPDRMVSAWIALSDSTPENGCMRVLPGSHLSGDLRHTACPFMDDNLLASGICVASDVDETRATDVVLREGELSLHHLNVIHGSNPNRSDRKRIGIAARYLPPQAKQLRSHHAVVLGRGRDDYGHYEHLTQSPRGTLAEGIAAQTEFVRRLIQTRFGHS